MIIHILVFLCLSYCTLGIDYRLPTTIVPVEYNLTLQPFFNNFTFQGDVSIEINISISHVSSTSSNAFSIELNKGQAVNIDSAALILSLNSSSDGIYESVTSSYNNVSEILALNFSITQAEMYDLIFIYGDSSGSYLISTLVIEYNGLLRFDLKGWYISQYSYNSERSNISNVTVYNAVTQFESTDARRAFPGWDEPSFKAVFKITMIAPVDSTVLSNMNQVSESTSSLNNCDYTRHTGDSNTACKVVSFAPSPPMSSYLVALVVGDYQSVSADIPPNDDPVRDYVLTSSVYFGYDINVSDAMFALNTSAQVLPYYESLFGIAFPLPKMDCIGLSDFAAGAMENWGLVTYRKTALFANPATSSESSLQTVAVVISHEYAHQWFGNLVTMKWWDDLWLNEGFASFVEYIGANYTHPEFDIWNQFLLAEANAMSADESLFTHPVLVAVEDPGEIDSIFDSITYDKGSSLIRMLYEYMGADLFMEGIQQYLLTYEFGNADTSDLWQSLSSASSMNITELMNPWVQQKGFPIIYASLVSATDDTVELYLRQQRLVSLGPQFWNASASNLLLESGFYENDTIANFSSELWQIPIEVEYGVDGSVVSVLMPLSDLSLVLDRNASDSSVVDFNVSSGPNATFGDGECFMLNHDENGFYRVLYDDTLYAMILDCFESLSELSQFSVLDDHYAFLFANYISPTEFFDLLLNISSFPSVAKTSEPSYLIWDDVIAALEDVDSVLCELYANGNEFNQSENSLNKTGPSSNGTSEYDAMIYKFRLFARDLLNPLWSRIGKFDYSENDALDVIYLRSALASALVRFEDDDVISYGYNQLYDIFVKQNDNSFSDYSKILNDNGEIAGINANLMEATLEAALARGDEDMLRHMIGVYEDANAEQQGYILSALGAVYQNETLLQQAIDFVLSSSVRDSNKISGLYSTRRCYGRNLLWSNLVANDSSQWNTLAATFGSGFLMSDLSELPKTFASKSYFYEIRDFYFDDTYDYLHLTSSNERSVNQTIESIAKRYEWLVINYDEIAEFLTTYEATRSSSHKKKDDGLSAGWIVFIVLISVAVVVVLVIVAVKLRRRAKGESYTKLK